MKSKKFLHILGVAGVIASTVPLAQASNSVQPQDSVILDQLEQTLRESSFEAGPAGSFDQMASRFKGKGDKGRPDVFGPPGRPEIGPPGHYQG